MSHVSPMSVLSDISTQSSLAPSFNISPITCDLDVLNTLSHRRVYQIAEKIILDPRGPRELLILCTLYVSY